MKRVICLLLSTLLLTACTNTENNIQDNDLEIQLMTKQFVNAISEKRSEGYINLIDQSFSVVRYFTSGGNGTRGKDVEIFIQKTEIPANLTVDIVNETPIILPILFQNFFNNMDEVQVIHSDKSLIDSATLTERVDQINSFIIANKIDDDKPVIITNKEYCVLVNASIIPLKTPIVTGVVVIFTKNSKNSFFLKSILDLR